jgi:hypothetical protein
LPPIQWVRFSRNTVIGQSILKLVKTFNVIIRTDQEIYPIFKNKEFTANDGDGVVSGIACAGFSASMRRTRMGFGRMDGFFGRLSGFGRNFGLACYPWTGSCCRRRSQSRIGNPTFISTAC